MAVEIVQPDALLTQINQSGAISTIQDDPDSPDGSWMTAIDDTLDSEFRVSFTDPTGAPRPGPNLQTIRVHCRRVPSSGGNNPQLTVDLYEAGTFVRAVISNVGITNLTGQTEEGLWNSSEVVDVNDVEFRFFADTVPGGPPTRRQLDFAAVEWVATLVAETPGVLAIQHRRRINLPLIAR